jgi:hypothetical protein
MTLNKDLFGKIPVTSVREPVTMTVDLGPTRYQRNPNQYKMFMRPREIKAAVADSVDREYSESMDKLWQDKAEESDYIIDDLQERGTIRHPVTLQEAHSFPSGIPELHMGQGHHRVAGAERYEKETGKQVLIPVVHDPNWNYTDSYDYAADYLNEDTPAHLRKNEPS